jgi:hypothetical protein
VLLVLQMLELMPRHEPELCRKGINMFHLLLSQCMDMLERPVLQQLLRHALHRLRPWYVVAWQSTDGLSAAAPHTHLSWRGFSRFLNLWSYEGEGVSSSSSSSSTSGSLILAAEMLGGDAVRALCMARHRSQCACSRMA